MLKMKVSPVGRAAIMEREGVRLEAYQDTRGIWTIGVGHTGMTSEPKPYDGMRITRDQADAFLAADLAPVEAKINSVCTRTPSQNEYDAMASLALNIGVNGYGGSSVVRHFNAGEIRLAANAFLLWDRPASLTARRQQERLQFLTVGTYEVAE